MLNMFIYMITIMYTPGPVTLLSISMGLKGKLKNSIGFAFGVGLATFLLLCLFGYASEKFIKTSYLIYISIIGCLYMIYLAVKLFKSKLDASNKSEKNEVSFKEGFFMQLFNPKAMLAVLPVATIHFPANDITGINIFLVAFASLFIVTGSPLLYCSIGQFFSQLIKDNRFFKILNKVMAVVLLYIVFTILYDHVYLVLKGFNAY